MIYRLHYTQIPCSIAASFTKSVLLLANSFTMVGIKTQYWATPTKDYQKTIKIVDEPGQPTVTYPLILQPAAEELSKEAILAEARKLGAQSSDNSVHSPIRQLLDANGGAIHFKGLPLKSADDFSEFMFALAGQGEHAWTPHVHKGMEVLRRPQANNVLTANEGPPSHFIGWHNEYAVSPVHPTYLGLFCKVAAQSGGETSVCNTVALYDRLKREVPDFVRGCGEKGLVYQIPHTAEQVGGIVGGNGLYKESAFGPKNGQPMPETEAGKREMVEKGAIELAKAGGWHPDIDKDDESLPVWQRRGFDWTWQENGDFEVVHRVAGVRHHPTLHKGTIFNVRGMPTALGMLNHADPTHRPCLLATLTPSPTTPSSPLSHSGRRMAPRASLSHLT